MYIGEFFDAILEEHEINRTDYNEAMIIHDVILWQGAMEVRLEYMYFKGV